MDIERAYGFFSAIWASAELRGWESVRLRLVDLQWFIFHIVKDEKQSLEMQNDLVFLSNIAAYMEFQK